jgi:hypothetical protein
VRQKLNNKLSSEYPNATFKQNDINNLLNNNESHQSVYNEQPVDAEFVENGSTNLNFRVQNCQMQLQESQRLLDRIKDKQQRTGGSASVFNSKETVGDETYPKFQYMDMIDSQSCQ